MASVQSAIISPKSLEKGDTIAIVSPAGAVDNSLFPSSIELLESQGWKVKVMPHAMGRLGTYSGTLQHRLEDFTSALLDPEVKALLCGRGGYGAMQLLPALDLLPIEGNPKWLIGFSDICALHGLWHAHGIKSLHSPMLRGLDYCSRSGDMRQADALFSLLRGEKSELEWDGHPLNREGTATGKLMGGNFSVLQALIGTKFDLLLEDSILFLEDVNEPIYKLERMLHQLHLKGVLPSLRALVLGQFTGSEADSNYPDAYSMIQEMAAPYGFPVAFGTPIGHKGLNLPLPIGATVTLSITPTHTRLAET